MKLCKNCGKQKPYSEFHLKADMADGYQSDCKECKNLFAKKWRKSRGKGIYAGKVNAHKLGGPYRVIYDPCDSFTKGSSFRRTEIAEMLANEYLAIGTRFRSDKGTWEVSASMTLREVTA